MRQKLIKALKQLFLYVCAYYNEDPAKLRVSKGRYREKILPRQITTYLFDKLVNDRISKAFITDFFGKDHSLLYHSRKTIANQCDTDKTIKREVDFFEVEARRILAPIISEFDEMKYSKLYRTKTKFEKIEAKKEFLRRRRKVNKLYKKAQNDKRLPDIKRSLSYNKRLILDDIISDTIENCV